MSTTPSPGSPDWYLEAFKKIIYAGFVTYVLYEVISMVIKNSTNPTITEFLSSLFSMWMLIAFISSIATIGLAYSFHDEKGVLVILVGWSILAYLLPVVNLGLAFIVGLFIVMASIYGRARAFDQSAGLR